MTEKVQVEKEKPLVKGFRETAIREHDVDPEAHRELLKNAPRLPDGKICRKAENRALVWLVLG